MPAAAPHAIRAILLIWAVAVFVLEVEATVVEVAFQDFLKINDDDVSCWHSTPDI